MVSFLKQLRRLSLTSKFDEKHTTIAETTTLETDSKASEDYYTLTPTGTATPKKGVKHIVQIGCGVVGSAYMSAFASKGHKVTGIEASPRIINNLSSDFEMHHVSDDVSTLSNVDLILISVCTPVKAEDGRLDMSYIYSTVDSVVAIVQNNPSSTVVIRSTVTPGVVNEYKKILDGQVGKDQVNVCFQPEFLRAKTAYDDAMNPWYVVIGTLGNVHPEALHDIYLDFAEESKIKIMTADEAELLKVFHNSFNACKISFFNECHLLCKAMNEQGCSDIDINVITETLVNTCEGLKNAHYGTKTGHGYYGTCLPKDSSELMGLEEEYGLSSRLFAEVVNVNNEIVALDKKENRSESLHGDFHKPCHAMMD